MVSVLGIVCSAFILFFLNPHLPAEGSDTESSPPNSRQTPQNPVVSIQTATPAGIPIRLKIPKIHVDTTLESVGLTSQGAVGVPKGAKNAAWYNRGPRPGDIGSAVVTGHYGYWKDGEKTIFKDLRKLKEGDRVSVEDEKGVVTMFVVRELRTYDQKEYASEVFVSNDGKAHLNLITCEGTWNETQKNYADRLVVFTDQEMDG